MDVMVAYANLRGWQTAKAGRPDIHRAGNALLRALAEGKIPWAFCPPNTAANFVIKDGIWLSSNTSELMDTEGENDSEEDHTSHGSEESQVAESDKEEGVAPSAGLSRFSALSLDASDESSVEEED